MSLFLNQKVGWVSYGGNSVFVEFIYSLVLLLCRNGVASSVISTSCSAEVNYYLWDNPLYASVLLEIRNRLVSSFLSREVGRMSYRGDSVLVEMWSLQFPRVSVCLYIELSDSFVLLSGTGVT